MKKLVMGCGCALVIVGIGMAVAGYYFVVRPAQTFVTSMTEISEVADLETALVNKATYTPPADATLAPAQVDRFMAVQQAVKAKLGTRFDELKAKYDQLDKDRRERERAVGFTEAVGAYRDLFALIAEARRAQVDALNAQQFSEGEYRWVRTRVFEAAGLEVSGVDLSDLVQKVQQGNFTLPDDQPLKIDDAALRVPEANRSLVKPHLDALRDWLPFAVFGL